MPNLRTDFRSFDERLYTFNCRGTLESLPLGNTVDLRALELMQDIGFWQQKKMPENNTDSLAQYDQT